VHPTFLYESIWCLAGFVMLFFYFKKRKFNGDLALRYAVWYGLRRFWIEGLRTDSLLLVPALNLRASQLVAAVTVLAALALELYLTGRAKKNQPLMVQLAVGNEVLKAMQAPDGPIAVILSDKAGKLPVSADRKTFEKATEEYNQAMLQALKRAKE